MCSTSIEPLHCTPKTGTRGRYDSSNHSVYLPLKLLGGSVGMYRQKAATPFSLCHTLLTYSRPREVLHVQIHRISAVICIFQEPQVGARSRVANIVLHRRRPAAIDAQGPSS